MSKVSFFVFLFVAGVVLATIFGGILVSSPAGRSVAVLAIVVLGFGVCAAWIYAGFLIGSKLRQAVESASGSKTSISQGDNPTLEDAAEPAGSLIAVRHVPATEFALEESTSAQIPGYASAGAQRESTGGTSSRLVHGPSGYAWRDRALSAIALAWNRSQRLSIRVRLSQWEATLLSLVAFVLALVPSVLVVLDRWFGSKAAANYFRNSWCSVAALCDLALPPYFELVFVCVIGVFALVWLLSSSESVPRREIEEFLSPAQARLHPRVAQQTWGRRIILFGLAGAAVLAARQFFFRVIPGWELAALFLFYISGWVFNEVSLVDIKDALKRNIAVILTCTLFLVGLVETLKWFYSAHAIDPFGVTLLIVSTLGLLLYRKKVHPVFYILAVSIVVYTVDLDKWFFSVIGDEFSFYRLARELVQQKPLSYTAERLFLGIYVYGAHPFFSSVIQAVSMMLLDVENFGWRFSSIAMSALSLPFFFVFYRSFLKKWLAFSATIILGASHYLMSFSRIGYNNTQALLSMGTALAAAGWAIRSGRNLAFAVLGGAIAFCFYVYPAGIYVVPIVLLLVLFYCPPSSRQNLTKWGIMLISALILISPLFSQPDYWTSKLAGTFLIFPQQAGDPKSLIANIARDFIYSFFSILHIPSESHFVTVSYVDPLTAVFVLLGFAHLSQFAATSKFGLYLVVSYIVLLLFVGSTSGRPFPSTTRMFLVLPWFSALAALGLAWVVDRFRFASLSARSATGLLAVLFSITFGLNLYQAYFVSVKGSDQYQDFEANFLRLAQGIAGDQGHSYNSLVVVNDPRTLDIPSQRDLLQLYYLDVPVEEVRTPISTPSDSRDSLLKADAIVVVSPRLTEDVRARYEDFMRANQRMECDMKTLADHVRFSVWYAPDRVSPCTR